MSDPGSDWRPTADLATLRRRAELAAVVRSFFARRDVLEVEVPVVGLAAVPDLHLQSPRADFPGLGEPSPRYLQTSPELFLKRLIAAEPTSVYSLGKAFRDGERGRRHLPELTMLEWYRIGWDHHRLMDEIDDLLAATLDRPPAERRTYAELFVDRFAVDPHRASARELSEAARRAEIDADLPEADRDQWLQLLFAVGLEPDLGRSRPLFVTDFPVEQAALARVRPGDPPVAERFEVFVDGVELANGYHELTDADEQRRRFERDLAARAERGLDRPRRDERFLDALDHGLPSCSGVALGFDRLVMLATGAVDIRRVVAFGDA